MILIKIRVLSSFLDSLFGKGKPILVVHGVYGAGKSLVLSVLIIFLWRAKNAGFLTENTRIVFSSMTNVAVDRVLQSLLELGFDDFVRVGSIKKIAKPILPKTCQNLSDNHGIKDLQEMLQRDDLSQTDRQFIEQTINIFQLETNRRLIKESFLVGITALATSFEVVDGLDCPILILDECSQMTEPLSLLPIFKFSPQWAVLVGDPKQLAPTLSYSIHPKLSPSSGLERTLFERLLKLSYRPIVLNIQYRCHPDISRISNYCFYNGILQDGATRSSRNGLVGSLGAVAFVQQQSSETKVSSSYINEPEANLIVSMITAMVNSGKVNAVDIGVISFYKPQAEHISQLLKQAKLDSFAATVDSFQGAENQIIIVSTVRTSSTEFLEEPRRVNVALTRAKRHLVIVANMNMVRASNLWSKVLEMSQKARNSVMVTEEFFDYVRGMD